MESSAEKLEAGVMMMNAVDQFPFMGHVLVVLVITYLFLSFTSNGFFYFCFFIVYLFEVERRGRERERRRIASEERRKINTRRTFDEGETLRWLNEGIKSMWPVCMEKFASKHFFGPMVPEFLNIYKPWGVNEVKIDSLHLGSIPPVFNFVRTLERPAEGDHVVYESTMDFCSGDDMNAKMSVQTIRRFGGFWTTFYISRLHVQGTVRVSVKFLKGWPVVGRVRLCFASKPKVTMSYRPMDRNGIDVSLIPVFANMVEKMVDNAMEHSIVQPNIFVVDIEKLVSSMFSDSKAQQGATGIFKVENKSTLVVEILEATNLKAADSNGLSDPFVEMTFGQQQKKTKVIRKTLNPKWENEQHEFPIINWDMSNLLTLRVRDWDRVPTIGFSHELGICTVPVNEYRNGERRELDLPLEKVSKGRLRFAITVNYTHRPQVAQEPPRNNSGRETVTQEIKTSSSAADHTSPSRASEIKRSKSEANLERLRTPLDFEGSKHSSQNSAGEPALLEARHEHTPIGESHDIIHMPYGPPGAFTIFHPGLVSPLRSQLSKGTEPLVTESSELDKGGGAEIKQRRLRYFRRRKRRNNSGGTNFLENIQADTMSEGDSSSVDFSAELKDFIPEPYHGPVKMTLDCAGATDIAPAEPPLMDQLAPLNSHLEPILGGKTPTTPAINMFFGNAEGNISAFRSGATAEGEVDTRDSLLSDRPKVESGSAVTNLNVGGLKTDKLAGLPTSSTGSHPQRRRRSSPKRQPAKPIFSLPTTWYKKMTLLAKRAKRKTRHEKSEVVSSSELKYPSGYYAEGDRPVSFYHEDSDTSIPSGPQASFHFESPLDTKRITNAGGTPGTAQFGDSPEQRKIINSRSSASGSQSDRHWASKVKKLIPDQFRTSQSFRHESLDLRRLQTPIRDSSLQSIPERSGNHRNGRVRG